MESKWINYFWCSVICMLLVGLTGSFPCFAETGQRNGNVTIVDEAAVLMEEEADWLKSVAMELSEKSGWNVIVASCQDAGGKTAQTVCEENFNRYTADENGISCLVDLDNHEIYLATAGEAISYLSDDRINRILDEAYQAAAKEDYTQCLYLMLIRAGEWYDKGETAPGMKFVKWLGAVAAPVFVLVILLIPGMKRFRTGQGAGSVMNRNQNLYHRRIRNNRTSVSRGSRTRTTVHRGAGGRRFGGGGRKF